MQVFNLEKISYSYKDGKRAVEDVSFDVTSGQSLTIIGTNGSGKSTLLYLMNGLIKPESGIIKIFGLDIKNGFASDLRQRISLLFQDPHAQLFHLNVWDELCFGPAQLGLTKDEISKRADDILNLLGIGYLKERGPWDLSGGEMKKVALGTCLSINPDVILLDEPTTGLDPRSQVELIDIIDQLRKAGKTIITATHDIGIIEDISDRTIVLGEDHRVILDDKPWNVMKNTEALLKANLIHRHVHRHSWYVHEHSHFGTHAHEHVDISENFGNEKDSSKEVILEMREIEKLKKLLEHWSEHNEGHAKTYLEWAEKAGSSGNLELRKILEDIAENTKKMDKLFEKAKKIV